MALDKAVIEKVLELKKNYDDLLTEFEAKSRKTPSETLEEAEESLKYTRATWDKLGELSDLFYSFKRKISSELQLQLDFTVTKDLCKDMDKVRARMAQIDSVMADLRELNSYELKEIR